MQKLADAYKAIYNGVTIEIQQTGSGAGITSTIEGACDIGMSSRELKDEELAEGIQETQIAMDGIAVVVNNENTVDNLDIGTDQTDLYRRNHRLVSGTVDLRHSKISQCII